MIPNDANSTFQQWRTLIAWECELDDANAVIEKLVRFLEET